MSNPNLGKSSPFYGQPYNIGAFANFNSTTTGTLVKTGEGALINLVFNTATAGSVITLYDGTSTSGTVIAVITVPASPQLTIHPYGVYFNKGLFVVVATQASDFTINYR